MSHMMVRRNANRNLFPEFAFKGLLRAFMFIARKVPDLPAYAAKKQFAKPVRNTYTLTKQNLTIPYQVANYSRHYLWLQAQILFNGIHVLDSTRRSYTKLCT